jgi:2-haloacid dehalogenase
VSAPAWVSFDCYGTLIDWDSGITTALEALVPGRGAELRAGYDRHESEVEAERPFRRYREVLAEGLRRSARAAGIDLPPGADGALAASLPDWPVFDDVGQALGALRRAGHRLAVLSNVDPDLFAATRERLPVEIDLVVTAVTGDRDHSRSGHVGDPCQVSWFQIGPTSARPPSAISECPVT